MERGTREKRREERKSESFRTDAVSPNSGLPISEKDRRFLWTVQCAHKTRRCRLSFACQQLSQSLGRRGGGGGEREREERQWRGEKRTQGC